jgi:hypothetical protein
MDMEAPGGEVGTSKNHGGQGSHSKPICRGASGAYAPGPDDEEEEEHNAFNFYNQAVQKKEMPFFTFFLSSWKAGTLKMLPGITLL